MGVISRQVFPVCESLCFFCPALRARSRHPGQKRYDRELLAEIFPRSPDEEPNDRKISKLCEYASKTPLRIPRKLNANMGLVLQYYVIRGIMCLGIQK
ncbi:unnamed protein product [Prunus armeniaca]|uniref:Uncharacterized protein n=1 Tax=Prunus armeniaca TaxID=36596 RepID=A0A6J5U0N0_PRUAR|nr:unnamed protein product [Prunus armeniaca]